MEAPFLATVRGAFLILAAPLFLDATFFAAGFATVFATVFAAGFFAAAFFFACAKELLL
ncbi:MAG: hypothetical protein ACNYPE_12470 [Candidatus Azotimanducaceae bacterium WSBS_2022_MAG_OTU7]